MPDDEKGKFTAEIGQDVIEAALNSVRKRTGGDSNEVPVEVEPAAPAAPPAAAPAEKDPRDEEITSLQARLEFSMAKGQEMLGKLKEEHERMLRATADLDNYKKRAVKEKEEVQKFGSEKLLKDFLPVIDNLDRALDQAGGDFESLKKGVAMTRKLFEDTLAKHAVKALVSIGKPFDPRLHEAMQQVERSDVPPNQVVLELVRGYTLNDRLMRPALVAISKAPAVAPVAAQPAEAGASGDAAGSPAPGEGEPGKDP